MGGIKSLPLPTTNPYQFIPFPLDVPRAAIPAAAGHGQTGAKGFHTGRLTCTIHQETPILAITRGDSIDTPPAELPASGLRGMIRSVAEIAGQGCGAFIGKNGDLVFNEKGRGQRYRIEGARFPDPSIHVPCDQFAANASVIKKMQDQDEGLPELVRRLEVCRPCSMFGFTLGQAAWCGRVRISSASTKNAFTEYQAAAGLPLRFGSPMVHHQDFYFKSGSYSTTSTYDAAKNEYVVFAGELAGRKVYQHRGGTVPVDTSRMEGVKVWTTQGTETFEFTVAFENLQPNELGLLCFAIELAPDLRHHFGFGKPAGFGSIRIAISAELWSRNRYQPNYKPIAVPPQFISGLKGEFSKSLPHETAVRSALGKWLAWPARARADIAYPPYPKGFR